MTALRFAARSDVGLLRDGNEDSLYAGPRLLAVADGMGGAAAGEVASAVAIAALAPLDEDAPGADLLEALSAAAYDANDHLRELIAHDVSLSGMGTTLTAMLIAGTRIGLLHIGDSRAYLLRDGDLTQITHDHTLVQSFVDEGRITLEQASSHPQRALILRALKGDDEMDLDLSVRDTKPGDRYLLCSDGLSGVVSDQTLRETLQAPDPQAAVDRMVELALRAGGPDNITCIVADVLDESTGRADVVVAGAAAEHTAESFPRPDTPAARASMMTVAKKAPTAVRAYGFAHAAPRRRHPVRLTAVLVLLLALVVGGVWAGRAYIDRQYYVGVSDGQVTVFRGVPDSFARNLSSVKLRTGIPVAGLLPFWRDKVQDDITTGSLGGAQQIVAELRANQLPPVRRIHRDTRDTRDTSDTSGLPADSHQRNQHRGSRSDRDLQRRGPVTAVAAGSLTQQRTGRRPEALMLALGLLVDLAAYVAVGVGHDKSFPPSIGAYAAGFAALYLAAHLAVRRLAPYADPLLLPLVAFLNGLGLVLIHRLDLADDDRARQAGKPYPHGDAHLQFVWMVVGLVLFAAVLAVVRDHRTLQRYTYTAMAAGIVLLLIPAALPARYSEVNGAKIWIRLGGLSFQPSEVAKILLILFFAGYFVAKRDVLSLASRRFFGLNLPRGRDLGPVLLAWLLMLAVLVFERDLGTSLLFFGIFTAMLYVATERTSWLVIGLVLFCAGSYAAYRLFAHVTERVDIWLHPWSQQQGHAYQLVQGLFGLGTGGVLGTGLGLGRPDLVPFAKTDFITATLGEELGLVGLTAVLVVYGIVVQRGLRTAVSVRDTFGKLLVTGLAFSLALQVFVVVGGVTRLIPLTGMTLPFMSYGGSSLVANWVIIGLMVRVSDAARRPVPQAAVRTPAGDDTQVIAP